MWQFDHSDRWHLIPNPVPDDEADMVNQLAAAGYEVLGDFGHDASSLRLTVFANEQAQYIVALEGPVLTKMFAIADLPSLLAYLPGLMAMVRDAATIDREEREFERRRRRNSTRAASRTWR
jgi:hypothetical protein